MSDEIKQAPMRTWHADDGVDYFIAARTVREAFEVYCKHTIDVGLEEPDEFSLELVTDEAAKAIKVRDEDTAATSTIYDLAQKAAEPELLSCSEW